MRCLVVKAHPLSESLCSSLAHRIEEMLQANGHEVTMEDLYVESFDTTMTSAERASYYDGPYSTQSVATLIECLLSAEAIVLVFPTWCFSFLAVLKGWFDRVWGLEVGTTKNNEGRTVYLDTELKEIFKSQWSQ